MRAGFAKLFVVVLAALSAAALYRHVRSSVEKPNSGIPREVIALYASWKQSHGKLYATPAENDHRLKVFYSQKQFVDKANIDYAELRLKRDGEIITENPFALNAFADLTEEAAGLFVEEIAEQFRGHGRQERPPLGREQLAVDVGRRRIGGDELVMSRMYRIEIFDDRSGLENHGSIVDQHGKLALRTCG